MASESENISNRRRRVTLVQLEVLWEFLSTHREIAMGYNKTAHAREHSKRMWENITASLNSQGEGAVKTWKEWSCYWVDYKSKLKKRVGAVRRSQNITGGGPASVPPLNDIEKKYLSLMGEDYGTGLPNIQVDPLAPRATSSSENLIGIAADPSILQFDTQAEILSQAGVPPLEEAPPLQEVPPLEEVPLLEVVPPQDAVQPPTGAVYPSIPPNRSTSRRRRRRETHPLISKEEARYTLINISKERLELERKNSETLQRMLVVLNNIAEKLNGVRETSNEGTSGS